MKDDLFDVELDAGLQPDAHSSRRDEAATIEVRRRKEWFGRLLNYLITLDGRPAAPLTTKQSSVYRVRPGHHTISAMIGTALTRTLDVQTKSGKAVVLLCGSSEEYRFRWNGTRVMVMAFALPTFGMLLSFLNWLLPPNRFLQPIGEGLWLVLAVILAIQIMCDFRLFFPGMLAGTLISIEPLEDFDAELPECFGIMAPSIK